MRIGLSHCLALLLIFSITYALASGSPRSISINTGDDNCTRSGDTVICPCGKEYNGTLYPCFTPVDNATDTNGTCFECPVGSYSLNNTDENCGADCADGSCIDPALCTPCPSGQYSNTTNSTQCIACSNGYISRDEGASNCSACMPGYTSAHDHKSCEPCPAGQFSTDFGSPSCLLCDVGEYSKATSQSCSKCPKGTYNSQKGQPFEGCRGCPQGTYSDVAGLDSQNGCVQCPAGTYCQGAATVVPLMCPRNYYCAAGTKDPSKCSTLYRSNPGATSCKPGTPFYVVIVGCIGAATIAFMIGWRWRAVKQQRLQNAYRQTEIERLIPKPRDGPVYTGF